MRNLIRGLGKKHTVILSSHVLSEIQAVCDRIVVINNGQLVADESTQEITSTVKGIKRLQLHISGSDAYIMPALRSVEGVTRARKISRTPDGYGEYVVEYNVENDIRKGVFNAMAKINCPIVMMRNAEMSLEDAFLKITNGENVTSRRGGRK